MELLFFQQNSIDFAVPTTEKQNCKPSIEKCFNSRRSQGFHRLFSGNRVTQFRYNTHPESLGKPHLNDGTPPWFLVGAQ